MIVKAWSGGSYKTYGIRIGIPNRVKYFEREWKEVSISINGTFYSLIITPGFWKKCPEIRGRVFKELFESIGMLKWEKQHPPQFELTPLKDNRFRLD